MATVNLGSIKFKWKGTYSGATAYTIDDVVEYNGSSYICILASTGNLPTNATYFEQMSSAGTNGTNGTDLTTTLTTQGDLVYRDGSGLQRLGAGTAGQLLQTGGAGANVSWVNAPVGGAISTNSTYFVGVFSTTSTTPVLVTNQSITLTPASTSSKFLVMAHGTTNGDYVQPTFYRDSTNLATGLDSASAVAFGHQGAPTGWANQSIQYIDAPNTTSSITYELRLRTNTSSANAYWGDGTSMVNSFHVIEL
jgi:hypothetical protein